MIDISKWAFENKKLIYFLIAVLIVGGAYSSYEMSKLEDPEITVKLAMVVTTYPGASAHQVDIILTQNFNNSHQYVAVAADLLQIAYHHGFNPTVLYCVQHGAQTDAVFQGIAAAMVKRCAAYKESMPCCFVDKVIQPVKGNARIAVGAAHINPDIVVSHKVHCRSLFHKK